MHTKKWLWRLDHWHQLEALLGGWDISPSPYIKIFICVLLMLWPSGSSEQNSSDLWNSVSEPKYLHSTYLTPRPVGTDKEILLSVWAYPSEQDTDTAKEAPGLSSALCFPFLCWSCGWLCWTWVRSQGHFEDLVQRNQWEFCHWLWWGQTSFIKCWLF